MIICLLNYLIGIWGVEPHNWSVPAQIQWAILYLPHFTTKQLCSCWVGKRDFLPDDFLRISRSQVFPRRMRKTLPATKAPHAKEAKSLRGAVEEQCWDRIVSRSWRNHSWLMEWIHWLMERFIQYMKKPMLHLTFFIWRSKSCWFLQNGSIWKRLICPCSCRTWCLKSSLRWELLPRIALCGWGSFTRNWCPHSVT